MIESPVLQELLAENAHQLILGLLEDRFGPVPTQVVSELSAIKDGERLKELNKLAARCPDLDAFRRQLAS